MPSPTHPGTCTKCKRSTKNGGAPLHIFQSGKYAGFCHRCKWEASALTTASAAQPCQSCNRAYDRSGTLLRLHRSGKYQGMCLNCKKQAQAGTLPPEYMDPGLRRYLSKRRQRLHQTNHQRLIQLAAA